MPRKEKDKDWYTIEEAAEILGVKRATVYYYLKDLDTIVVQKFGRDRKGYLSATDIELLKTYKEEPWKVVKPTPKAPGVGRPRKPRPERTDDEEKHGTFLMAI